MSGKCSRVCTGEAGPHAGDDDEAQEEERLDDHQHGEAEGFDHGAQAHKLHHGCRRVGQRVEVACAARASEPAPAKGRRV